MAKHINIKTGKPQICGRAPLLINEKHSNAAKTNRYYKYQMLFNHYHPNWNQKPIKAQPIMQQPPIAVERDLKAVRTKWWEVAPHWIVELFTRDKSGQEILSGTA